MTDSAATAILGSPSPAPAPSATPSAPSATPAPGGAPAPAGFAWEQHGIAGEDLGYIQTKQYKGPADILKALRGAETLIGRDKLVMPTGEDDTEGWNRVYKQLGRPDSVDGYKLELPEGHDKDYVKSMLAAMHGGGVTQKAAERIVKANLEFAQKQQQASKDAAEVQRTTDINDLRREWGQGYDTQAAHMDRAAAAYGLSADDVQKMAGALGTKRAAQFLAKLGGAMAEDASGMVNPDGRQGGADGKLTPQQAMHQIATLRADAEFVKKYTSGNPEAKRKMELLHQMAYPV